MLLRRLKREPLRTAFGVPREIEDGSMEGMKDGDGRDGGEIFFVCKISRAGGRKLTVVAMSSKVKTWAPLEPATPCMGPSWGRPPTATRFH